MEDAWHYAVEFPICDVVFERNEECRVSGHPMWLKSQ